MKRLLLLLAVAAVCQTVRAQEPVLPDFNPEIESETAAPAESETAAPAESGTADGGDGRIVVSRYEGTTPVRAVAVQQMYPVKDWRIALDFGYSYYTVYDPDLPSDMRSGFYYGADIQYFWWRFLGAGVKFVGNRYARSTWDVAVDTYYVGPVLSSRLFSRADRNAWVFSVSAGYVAYHERSRSTGISLNRGGFKMTAEIGYDIRIAGSGTFLGLKIAATQGYVPVTFQGVSETIGLHALELGVGLRF